MYVMNNYGGSDFELKQLYYRIIILKTYEKEELATFHGSWFVYQV